MGFLDACMAGIKVAKKEIRHTAVTETNQIKGTYIKRSGYPFDEPGGGDSTS